MSQTLPDHVLRNILQRFSTDEFYLWTVKRNPDSDSYRFNFSYNDSVTVIINATGTELRSYNKPEYAMHKALRHARDTGRFMGGQPVQFRLSELVANMPLSKQPARRAHSLPQYESVHGPTEAMLEASYRV